MSGPVEVPPDATRFASRGKHPMIGPSQDGGLGWYWLYLGAAEMRALQIEWGLTRLPTDTKEEWAAKFASLHERAGGEDWADKVTIFRVCLSRWAVGAGNGSGPVTLDDAAVIEIIDHAVLPGMTPRLGAAYRINALWERFSLDMLGAPEADGDTEEEAAAPDPKAKRGRRGSALRASSPRA